MVHAYNNRNEVFFGKRAYVACNAAKIVKVYAAFAAGEIHSQSTPFLTIARKNSEQI